LPHVAGLATRHGIQPAAAAGTGRDYPPHSVRFGLGGDANRSVASHPHRSARPACELRSRRAYQAWFGRCSEGVQREASARACWSGTMIAAAFLSIKDFTPRQIRFLLSLRRQIKGSPHLYCEALKGKTLAMIFEKPSLRTRVTFDVGIQQLGGFSLYLSPAEINLGKRESVYDVAKNLERMVQGIMIRTFAHRIVDDMAAYAGVPLINGITHYSHPCHALADYLTIWEIKKKLAGLKVVFAGDGNNVAHSL